MKCGYGAMMLLIAQAIHYLKCGYGAIVFREWEGCYVKHGYGAMRAWETI